MAIETSVAAGHAGFIKEAEMIVVMGASGHTGKQIAEALLARGETVRALGRSVERLAGLQFTGAEVRTGDANDAAFLTDAFRHADAVYTLMPSDRQAEDYKAAQRRQGEAIVQALRASGVRFVVALSSLGADVAEGHGLIAVLHDQEQRLRTLEGRNILLLRPASFFENFVDALPLVRQEGILADSVSRDLAIPMVATRDIASAAAQALISRDWSGIVVRELLGARDISYAEATGIIGRQLGKPDLPYVQLSFDDMAGALVQAGLSASFARLYAEMTRAFNEERVGPLAGRTRENTTPTTFEEFATGLPRIYEGV